MSRISSFGPKEDPHAEYGPVYVYGAEALGTDGQWHMVSVFGQPTPYVEVQEACRLGVEKILKQNMIEKGVWSDAS